MYECVCGQFLCVSSTVSFQRSHKAYSGDTVYGAQVTLYLHVLRTQSGTW